MIVRGYPRSLAWPQITHKCPRLLGAFRKSNFDLFGTPCADLFQTPNHEDISNWVHRAVWSGNLWPKSRVHAVANLVGVPQLPAFNPGATASPKA
eukprot:1161726-Pelagomonas_calceolata.AAC.9